MAPSRRDSRQSLQDRILTHWNKVTLTKMGRINSIRVYLPRLVLHLEQKKSPPDWKDYLEGGPNQDQCIFCNIDHANATYLLLPQHRQTVGLCVYCNELLLSMEESPDHRALRLMNFIHYEELPHDTHNFADSGYCLWCSNGHNYYNNLNGIIARTTSYVSHKLSEAGDIYECFSCSSQREALMGSKDPDQLKLNLTQVPESMIPFLSEEARQKAQLNKLFDRGAKELELELGQERYRRLTDDLFVYIYYAENNWAYEVFNLTKNPITNLEDKNIIYDSKSMEYKIQGFVKEWSPEEILIEVFSNLHILNDIYNTTYKNFKNLTK